MVCKEDIEQFAYEVALTWSQVVGGLSEGDFLALHSRIANLLIQFSETD